MLLQKESNVKLRFKKRPGDKPGDKKRLNAKKKRLSLLVIKFSVTSKKKLKNNALSWNLRVDQESEKP
jgi:hypothetical protein